MKDKMLRVVHKKGPMAAINHLNRHDDPIRALISYDELIREVYWKDKDILATVTLAQAAIDHGTYHAERTDNPELVDDYYSKIKTISYNLASFTWPGWKESGIEISDEHIAIGLEAAHTNLKLAVKLNRDALRMAYAYWVLAAQYIAAKDLPAAKSNFVRSAKLAEEAGEHSAVLLSNGFEALVDMLSSPHDAAAKERYNDIKSQFEAVEHGDDYIKQMHTAWKVFSSPDFN